MRNINHLILHTMMLLSGFNLQANTEDKWSEERCAQLSLSDPTSQQLQQQHCSETVAARANVMPVQLDVQLVKPAAVVAEAPVPAPRATGAAQQHAGDARQCDVAGISRVLVVDGAQIVAPPLVRFLSKRPRRFNVLKPASDSQ